MSASEPHGVAIPELTCRDLDVVHPGPVSRSEVDDHGHAARDACLPLRDRRIATKAARTAHRTPDEQRPVERQRRSRGRTGRDRQLSASRERPHCRTRYDGGAPGVKPLNRRRRRSSSLAERAAYTRLVLVAADPFDTAAARRRLAEAGGGYETVHSSTGLEIAVYVLVAPEPDRQQPHARDEVYVVLEGDAVLEVGGRQVPVTEGSAVLVPAGAEHRFTGYEQLSVLVIEQG